MSEQSFADQLEDCLAWMQDSGGTPDQAAARYPDQAEALLPFLRRPADLRRRPGSPVRRVSGGRPHPDAEPDRSRRKSRRSPGL